MRHFPFRISAAAALAGAAAIAIVGAPAASADTIGDTARTLMTKNKGAVVQFSVVVKISAGGQEQNVDQEAKGVVIDPSGLIVTTNYSIDPTSILASMGGESSAQYTSKVVSIRIISPDGEEVPAKVVLRDTDRNLAFIRPLTAPTAPMPFVDLKSGGKAQMGDVVFIYGRMGKSGNRGPEINYTRITGVVERPRLQYVIQPLSSGSDFGAMAFNEQGLPLGLLSFRVAPGSRGRSNSDALMIVVPTEDIAEIGAQAPQVKDVKDEVVPTDAKPATPAKAAPVKPAAPPKKK